MSFLFQERGKGLCWNHMESGSDLGPEPTAAPCWPRVYLLIMLPDLIFLRSRHVSLVACKKNILVIIPGKSNSLKCDRFWAKQKLKHGNDFYPYILLSSLSRDKDTGCDPRIPTLWPRHLTFEVSSWFVGLVGQNLCGLKFKNSIPWFKEQCSGRKVMQQD